MAELDFAQKEKMGVESYKNFQVIVFKLGTEEYGLTIDQIKEVVITPNITKVPLAAFYVKGVANVRGNILAVIDLEERFGLRSAQATDAEEKHNYTLVVESDDLKMGILVKDVPNTLSISEKNIDESPNIIQDQNVEKNYIKGIIKLQNRLIILIDIFKVIAKEEVKIG